MDFAPAWRQKAAVWSLLAVARRAASASACNASSGRIARTIRTASMAAPTRSTPLATFPPAHRLRHKPEFDLLYREGRRLGDEHFLLIYRANDRPHPRLGLSIAAKTVGNAVNRNRIKRVLRESFRQHAHRLPRVDIVVNARPAARAAVNAALARSIVQLWDKLARHA